MTAAWDRAAPGSLYVLELEGGGQLTLFRDVTDPRGLVLALSQAPVLIAAPIPREQVQHFVQALDDFLYESRPR